MFKNKGIKMMGIGKKSIGLLVLSCFLLTEITFANPTLPKAPYVTRQDIKQWDAEGKVYQFIDVRRPDEFSKGHLPDAINIPYDDLEKRAGDVPKDRPAVFYCTISSWRAPYAANLFLDLGYSNSYVLEGGASGWNGGGQVIYASDPRQKAEIIPKPSDLQPNFEHPPVREYQTKLDLTLEQLKEFDGNDGRPAYVAVNGLIYDLTESRLWRGGVHDPSHGEATAGRDLTELLKDAPHGDKHLKDFPIVGRLVSKN